jgi:hypothetical protein
MTSAATPSSIIAGFAELLDEAGVPYMLTGSFASGIHGQPRASHDIAAVLLMVACACQGQPRRVLPAPALVPPPRSSLGASERPVVVAVPLVGCGADGQLGPVAAPPDSARLVQLPPAMAERLAFYKAEYAPLTLAPRGWRCAGTYGSDGSVIVVVPTQNTSQTLIGPAVLAAASLGATSGREVVAELRARSLPGHLSTQNEGATGSVAPYPEDRLVHRSSRVVEFTTPANTIGLGTERSGFQPDALPVHGVVIFDGPELEENALFLAIRLPFELQQITPIIVSHATGKLIERPVD